MHSHSPRLVAGLWCATLTPLTADGGIDHPRLVAHVQHLLAHGVAGAAPFGTTGEGPSLSVAQRRAGIDALLAAGVAPTRILPGTGCASLAETIELTRHAVTAGCVGALVLPPFFWKAPSDDGIFAWYARVIEGVADARLRVLLYHLPQFSAVPLSVDLVARLAAAFPGAVAGVKDSGGDWTHTQALLARLPELSIVIGHEPDLPRLMRAGGAGTICGVANVLPDLVAALLAPNVTAQTEAQIARFIEILFAQPFLPALKSILADQRRDPVWRAVCPPLVALTAAQQASLRDALRAAGFA